MALVIFQKEDGRAVTINTANVGTYKAMGEGRTLISGQNISEIVVGDITAITDRISRVDKLLVIDLQKIGQESGNAA